MFKTRLDVTLGAGCDAEEIFRPLNARPRSIRTCRALDLRTLRSLLLAKDIWLYCCGSKPRTPPASLTPTGRYSAESLETCAARNKGAAVVLEVVLAAKPANGMDLPGGTSKLRKVLRVAVTGPNPVVLSRKASYMT